MADDKIEGLKEGFTLDEVIDLVEEEFPDWSWMLGRCNCGEYRAVMTSPDYEPVLAIELTQRGPKLVKQGHVCLGHSKLRAGALGQCLELAQEVKGS